MITNPRVFEDGHLPRSLLHRNAELSQVARALEPVTRGEPADDLLISGPSGVGKTVLAQFALRHFDDVAHVDHSYVRCLGQTGGDILRAVLREHPDVDPAMVNDNTPVDELRDLLFEADDVPVVAILDEGDDLPDTDALELLTGHAALSLIVICHDASEWRSRLPADRARTFDADHHIALDKYSTTELTEILDRRARSGLVHGAVDRRQLEWIADEVAGVAREGIQSLHAAAVLAQERGHATIRESDLQDCFARARQQIRTANLRSLPYHHQVLYGLVYELQNATADQLHECYDGVADQLYEGHPKTPIGRRSRRNKLQKLQDYDLIDVTGANRNTTYRVRDADVTPSVTIDWADLPSTE